LLGEGVGDAQRRRQAGIREILRCGFSEVLLKLSNRWLGADMAHQGGEAARAEIAVHFDRITFGLQPLLRALRVLHSSLPLHWVRRIVILSSGPD
jgi:hypothetical protein